MTAETIYRKAKRPTKLSNLHEIMVDAAELCARVGEKEELLYQSTEQYDEDKIARLKTKLDRDIATQSFQLLRSKKNTLDDICRANNTTSSAFLRECVYKLLTEYGV